MVGLIKCCNKYTTTTKFGCLWNGRSSVGHNRHPHSSSFDWTLNGYRILSCDIVCHCFCVLIKAFLCHLLSSNGVNVLKVICYKMAIWAVKYLALEPVLFANGDVADQFLWYRFRIMFASCNFRSNPMIIIQCQNNASIWVDGIFRMRSSMNCWRYFRHVYASLSVCESINYQRQRHLLFFSLLAVPQSSQNFQLIFDAAFVSSIDIISILLSAVYRFINLCCCHFFFPCSSSRVKLDNTIKRQLPQQYIERGKNSSSISAGNFVVTLLNPESFTSIYHAMCWSR